MTTNTYKVTIILLLALLTTSGIWTVSLRSRNTEASEELDKERLKSEELLSEKLAIEKERDKATNRAKEIAASNEELIRKLGSVNKALDDASAEVKKLKIINSGERKKYNDLVVVRQNLEKQLESIKAELQKTHNENVQLSEKSNALQHEKQGLEMELQAARKKRFDVALIESTRGSSAKLVVKARRVQKLNGTLTLTSAVQDVQFKIIGPNGTALADSDGSLNSRTLSSDENSKRLEVNYIPKKKLLPGLYQIEVLSGELRVGSLQVRLR